MELDTVFLFANYSAAVTCPKAKAQVLNYLGIAGDSLRDMPLGIKAKVIDCQTVGQIIRALEAK